MRRLLCYGFLCLGLLSGKLTIAADAATPLTSPLPYQVLQRTGYNPFEAHPHAVGGAKRGEAVVMVSGALSKPLPKGARIEARTELLKLGYGQAVDWTDVKANVVEKSAYTGKLTVPAGGWYRLEVRLVLADGKSTLLGAVEPFGVGEVFIVAGQSYAGGHNDEILKVTEPAGRVVAFDVLKKSWGVANDPPPPLGYVGDAGSLWPPLGDLLVPIVQVPVAFVNVSEGATSTIQWLPDTPLYNRCRDVGLAVGQFRAVLWQQGESDVIGNATSKEYVERMRSIRSGLARDWKFSPTWLLAKSTLHHTVYNRPDQEGVIRAAIHQLWSEPGFAPGPDTDVLDGENRGEVGTKQHFTGVGQRHAALMWFAAIWHYLQIPPAVPAKK